MSKNDGSNRIPTRAEVGVAVGLVVLASASLGWEVAHYPDQDDVWDRLYVAFWVLWVVLTVAILAGTVGKRHRMLREQQDAMTECSSCDGRGAGGPASDESTNGRCWDCRGSGRAS